MNATGDITFTAATSNTIDGATTSSAGNITVTAGTTNTTTAALSGVDVSISGVSSTLVDVTGTGTVTLTGSSTTTNTTYETITGASIVFVGDGHTFASANSDDDLVGAVTVSGGASLNHNVNAGNLMNGAVTHSGSGTVAIKDLGGTYSGADATGAVTIADTAAGASSITTGSGDDSITTGDVEATIITGDGNDTINAVAMTSAGINAFINSGAGNDTITLGLVAGDTITTGSGSDTIRITIDTGAADTITDFTAGSAGDIIKFDASEVDAVGGDMTSDGATVVAVDTTDSSATAVDNTDILLLTGSTYATATAAITALNGSSGVTGITLAEKGTVMVYADTDGHSYLVVIEGDAANIADGGNDEVTLVTLQDYGIADVALLTADNFAVF
jgi:hypothetical protein